VDGSSLNKIDDRFQFKVGGVNVLGTKEEEEEEDDDDDDDESDDSVVLLDNG
jgi:hypothetical protein